MQITANVTALKLSFQENTVIFKNLVMMQISFVKITDCMLVQSFRTTAHAIAQHFPFEKGVIAKQRLLAIVQINHVKTTVLLQVLNLIITVCVIALLRNTKVTYVKLKNLVITLI